MNHEQPLQDIPRFPKPTCKLIAGWFRPVGHFNQKAEYLKAFAQMPAREYDGSLNRLFRHKTPELRKTLLAVKGIGSKPTDGILLYARKRPVFVVDAYVRRFLAEQRWSRQRRHTGRCNVYRVRTRSERRFINTRTESGIHVSAQFGGLFPRLHQKGSLRTDRFRFQRLNFAGPKHLTSNTAGGIDASVWSSSIRMHWVIAQGSS
jgi:hypothetical protein